MRTANWKVEHGVAGVESLEINGDIIDTSQIREIHLDLAEGDVSVLALVYRAQPGSITGDGIVQVSSDQVMSLNELDPDELEEEVLNKGDSSKPFSHQMLDLIREKIGGA